MDSKMKELKLQSWIFDRSDENEVAVFTAGEIEGEYGTEEELNITLTIHNGDDLWATVEICKGTDKVTKTMADPADALNYLETLCAGEVYEMFEKKE